MSVSVYQDYVASAEDADLLGNIVMYSVRSGVPTQTVEQQFLLCNLDSTFLPKPIQASDAWKKATKTVEQVEYDIKLDPNNLLAPAMKARLLIRNVSSDDTTIERHVVREIVDKNGKELSHDVVMKVRYWFHNERVTFERTEFVQPQEVDQMTIVENEINQAYSFHKDHLDGNALRQIIRNYIKSLHAVPVRDGVYFIAQDKIEKLDNLAKFTRAIGSRMYMVPLLAGDTEHTEMIREAYATQAEADMNSLMKAISDVRAKYAGKPIPKRSYEALVERFAQASQTKTDVETHVGDSIQAANDAFALCMRAMNDLASNIDGGA